MHVFATLARVLHVVILGVWFGSSAFYLVLEPAVERVLSSRHQIEAVMTAALAQIDAFGLFAGPVLLLTLFVGWVPIHVPLRFRGITAVLMTVFAGLSGRWLTPKLLAVKQAMGRPLEDMDPMDALALEYDQLQTLSMGFLILQSLLALVLITMAVRSAKPKRTFGIEL